MAVSGVNGGAIPLSPNAVINGGFDIWQRGTSFNWTGSGYSYTADRWAIYGYNASSTVSQQTFTPGSAPVLGYEGSYFARFNSTNTATFAVTRLENVRQFADQTVTLSYWAKSATAQTLGLVEIEQNFGSGGSASSYTSLTAPAVETSWARYTSTVTLPSISGKTVGSSSFIQIGLKGAINNALDIWGVQLEAGTVATPFKRNAPSIQAELAACQRYCKLVSVPYGTIGQVSASGSNLFVSMPIGIQMRTTPTITHTLTNANYAGSWNFDVSFVPGGIGKTGTVAVNPHATINQVNLAFTGATWSATPNAFATMTATILAEAEL